MRWLWTILLFTASALAQNQYGSDYLILHGSTPDANSRLEFGNFPRPGFAPSISPPGSAVLYFDSGCTCLKVSNNGGAYGTIGGAAVNPTSGVLPYNNAGSFTDSPLTRQSANAVSATATNACNYCIGGSAVGFGDDSTIWGPGVGVFYSASNARGVIFNGNQLVISAAGSVAWASNINSNAVRDTIISRTIGGVVSIDTSSVGNEGGLIRTGINPCRVTADITLPVNTATTVCSWLLPASAKAWAWQCQIPWVISAGTGTNTLAIIANPSQTPTAATNGAAEIKTTNTNTATEAVTAISASGATTLLTSGTITPAATVFMSSTSGTLLASATAGTFAIQMTAAGTTATAAAKAGATCWLY